MSADRRILRVGSIIGAWACLTAAPGVCGTSSDWTSKLTYRFNGRDMRLTDVHGNVIEEILA